MACRRCGRRRFCDARLGFGDRSGQRPRALVIWRTAARSIGNRELPEVLLLERMAMAVGKGTQLDAALLMTTMRSAECLKELRPLFRPARAASKKSGR
jgi:hypothetical protein